MLTRDEELALYAEKIGEWRQQNAEYFKAREGLIEQIDSLASASANGNVSNA
jgi:hypothetical protein